MAVTNVHPIRSTLSKAIEYIINPDKTEKRLYVNSFGCSTDYEKAAEEFLKIRSLGSGKGNVLAQHIVQSFYGKEVTPEQAIQIGEELAEKFLKGKFQYIIATHIDKDNIHNHIIFNNISFEDFKSFEYTENRGGKSWENLRNASDVLCREHGISVIENPQNNKGKCYYEWQQDSQGKSWKSKLRFAIDETIMESKSFDDFLDKIRAKNIECVGEMYFTDTKKLQSFERDMKIVPNFERKEVWEFADSCKDCRNCHSKLDSCMEAHCPYLKRKIRSNEILTRDLVEAFLLDHPYIPFAHRVIDMLAKYKGNKPFQLSEIACLINRKACKQRNNTFWKQ